MMSAAEAYTKTAQVQKDKLSTERAAVESKIQIAVNNGHFECEINKLSKKIEEELISSGYKVERHMPYNLQFDDPYFTISWRNSV